MTQILVNVESICDRTQYRPERTIQAVQIRGNTCECFTVPYCENLLLTAPSPVWTKTMACSTTILSLQRTSLAGRVPTHVVFPVSRRQVRGMRAGALSDIDVAQVVATTAEMQTGTETVDSTVYIVLGILLASFVGTFGIAPRFKSSFKEEDTCDSNSPTCTTQGESCKSRMDRCTWCTGAVHCSCIVCSLKLRLHQGVVDA
jgi:hypothetical protein